MKSANLRQFGEADMQSFWHYRAGDYRLICSIENTVLTVIVLRVKHRKDVYKKNV
jgi:mRNA interferase RelE/StbE